MKKTTGGGATLSSALDIDGIIATIDAKAVEFETAAAAL